MKLTIEGTPADVRQFLKTGDDKAVKITEEQPLIPVTPAKPAMAPLSRQQIVEKAKADIKNITEIAKNDLPREGNTSYRCLTTKPHFIVNREKRTVVCLVKGAAEPDLYERGKAKCTKDDVFNARIGKAIAVRRAYGLTVPGYYLHTPKPEGIKVGDIVQSTSDMYSDFPYKVNFIKNGIAFEHENGYVPIHYLKVIDDTDREY